MTTAAGSGHVEKIGRWWYLRRRETITDPATGKQRQRQYRIPLGTTKELRSEKAAGRTYNLGVTAPVDFAHALPLMAQATGLPLKTVDLPGSGVFYETANARIRAELGFEPQWTIERMIEEAAAARVARAKAA